MLKPLIIAALFLIAFSKHSCIFGKVEHPPLQYIASTAPALNPQKDERMMAQDWESIRIHADYSELTGVNETVKNYIQNEIMPSTISYFEATLKIKRLQNKLKISEICNGHTPNETLTKEGVDADLVILVVAIDDKDTQFVALSSPCGQSQVDDRPTYGLMTFNLAYILMETATDDHENLSTALHEMVHVLGFNTVLYPFFRNPDTGELLTNHVKTKLVLGKNITILDLAPLTSRLRTYFNCSTLEGAYLEDEGDALSAQTHFERRIFMNEFMTSSSITEPVISEFTLALLEGTGWYQVLYNMTEPFNWGRGEGCEFLDGPCVNDQGKPSFKKEWCDTEIQIGCTFTARAIGFCGTPDFNDTFADNCPYYASDFSYDCENIANQQYASFEEEIYGSKSRCFTGSLVKTPNDTSNKAFCFPTKCNKAENGTWTIQLRLGDQNVTCSKLESINITGFNGQLSCPDPEVFCNTSNPDFCNKGCTGKGRCVDGNCQCDQGWQGVDCSRQAPIPACINGTDCDLFDGAMTGKVELASMPELAGIRMSAFSLIISIIGSIFILS